MKPDQLMAAADVLGWVSGRMSDLPEEKRNAVVASLHCEIVRVMLIELATHLLDGMEPYEALLATTRGDLPLTERQQDVLRALMPPPEPKERDTPPA